LKTRLLGAWDAHTLGGMAGVAPKARVFTHASGLGDDGAVSQSFMPADTYNSPYARKAAILRGLGLGPVNDGGRRAPYASRVPNAELVLVHTAETRVEVSLEANESRRVVSLSLEFVPDGTLDLALGAHTSGLVRYLSTAWDRWARMPPAERCDFFKRHGAKTDASRASRSTRDIPALVPSNSCCSRDPITRPGPGLHAQTNYYHTDDDTPIFRALLPALIRDMAVIDRVRAELERDLESGENVKNVYHYALVSHPGHHAGPSSVGGYCYINNAAVLARALTRSSLDVTRVAVLDVDYHAGNGTAAIFWDDPDVFVASIHADPDGDYPWNSCYADDVGGGRGQGKTLCLPMPRRAGWNEYAPALATALKAIVRHDAQILIVSLGLDTHADDPVQEKATAGMELDNADYREMGRMIAAAGVPTVFVQEGGYQVEAAGDIVAAVFLGMEEGFVRRNPERGDPADVIEMQVRGELDSRRAAEARAKAKRATTASSGETGTETGTETETDEGEGGVGIRGTSPTSPRSPRSPRRSMKAAAAVAAMAASNTSPERKPDPAPPPPKPKKRGWW
jgi:acetoin utilization deacetylase AcuC-like enzyme